MLTIKRLSFIALKKNRAIQAWAGSAMTILGAACFGLGGLYPRLLPSSISDRCNLTIHKPIIFFSNLSPKMIYN